MEAVQETTSILKAVWLRFALASRSPGWPEMVAGAILGESSV